MKKRSEKQEDLDKLKSQLATVSTVILSTFQGITVEDDNKLRRAVEQAGGHYQVVKNTLAERAASGTPIEPLLKNLSGTNSIAYTATDPVSLAKALTKIAKDVPAFQFRAGIVEGRVLSIAENAHALIGAILKAKPSAAKGKFVKKVTLTSTMGPGVTIDEAEVESAVAAAA